VAWGVLSNYYNIPPGAVPEKILVFTGAMVGNQIHRGDLDYVRTAVDSYFVGRSDYLFRSPSSPVNASGAIVGKVRLVSEALPEYSLLRVPFVYEDSRASHLQGLVARYDLAEVMRGAADEYEAMLRLGVWLGSRWDHGTNEVPGGTGTCRVADVIDAGQRGARYWCEIAAKVAVQVATAMGWQARLVTVSRDGYTWEHAVAEYWSNRHAKWFVLDTDFNVVYERGGIPLSAFELCHLHDVGIARDEIEPRTLGAQKESLPLIDLLPFYEYVHVDLRNDWCSRKLAPGSPAGGESATWWTARDTLGPVLTAKVRVDDPRRFDWPVNWTTIQLVEAETLPDESMTLDVALAGYSPVFKAFQTRVDDSAWVTATETTSRFRFGKGSHRIGARILTQNGYCGPESYLEFEIDSMNR
jgi:hypothetical protein